MLIGLLGTSRHLFLTVFLAVSEGDEFVLALLNSHVVVEDSLVQIEQFVSIGRSGEHHATQVVGSRVHLGLGEQRDAHLVFENGLALLPNKNKV